MDCVQDRGVYSSIWVDSVGAGQLLLWEINPYASKIKVNINYVRLFVSSVACRDKWDITLWYWTWLMGSQLASLVWPQEVLTEYCAAPY